MSGLELPSSTRLKLVHTQDTVKAGALVNFASANKSAGLLRSFNLVINSTNYAYQEVTSLWYHCDGFTTNVYKTSSCDCNPACTALLS